MEYNGGGGNAVCTTSILYLMPIILEYMVGTSMMGQSYARVFLRGGTHV